MLVLEPLDAAMARGATIHGEVVGFGMSSDAQHLTHLSVDGPVRAMRAALRDAGLRPEQIGYVNAHGSGTQINDVVETRAIRELFGAHAERLPVSSTKSLHGHALGATGALEAVCTISWRWKTACFRPPQIFLRRTRIAILMRCRIALGLPRWNSACLIHLPSEATTPSLHFEHQAAKPLVRQAEVRLVVS